MNRKVIALIISLMLVKPSYGAMDLTAATDYLSFDGVSTGNTFAVSFWVYITAFTDSWECVTCQYLTTSGFYIRSSGAYVWNTLGGNPYATSTLVSGRWYFIVSNVSSNAVTYYLNGVADGSPVPTVTAHTLTAIGDDVGSESFNGLVDDVRVYNRILTVNEIESLYKSRGRLNITDGLVAWWRLDEHNAGEVAAGATIPDSAGANTMTANNSPVWANSGILNYP